MVRLVVLVREQPVSFFADVDPVLLQRESGRDPEETTMMGKQMLKNIRRGVRAATVLLAVTGLIGAVTAGTARAADDGFESIFDGKTLKNWDGNP